MTKSRWRKVPGGLAGCTYLERKIIDNDLEVEIWHHPEWSPALRALWRGRTKAIAKLLRAGGTVPEDVAKTLGELLDQKWGQKGPHLRLVLPLRGDKTAAYRELGKKRRIREQISAEYAKAGNLKAVYWTLTKELNCSVGYLRQCRALSDREIVRQAELIITQGVSSRATRKRPLA